jgi:hypothetical protein
MSTSTRPRRLPLPEIGTRFGQRVVASHLPRDRNTVSVLMRCDCGREGPARLRELLAGRYPCCLPCSKKPDRSALPPLGSKLGERTITAYDFSDPKRIRVLVQCKCGHIGGEVLSYLLQGKYPTCISCSKGQPGHSRHPLYDTWKRMWSRTTNPNDPEYPRYGARGITVCEEWRDFQTFLRDMGPRPEGKPRSWTVERLDNEKGYSKSNCGWRTMRDQSNNTRRNRLLTWNGETLNVTQWAEKLGFPAGTLFCRLHDGWDVERTLTTPRRVWPGRR